MKTCYQCRFFLKEQHENLPYPLDFYACDSTDKKVKERLEDLGADWTILSPDNVAENCPGFQEQN